MGLQRFKNFAPFVAGVIAIMIVVAAIGLVLSPTDTPPQRPQLRVP